VLRDIPGDDFLAGHVIDGSKIRFAGACQVFCVSGVFGF
jgi:hypothetical protein